MILNGKGDLPGLIYMGTVLFRFLSFLQVNPMFVVVLNFKTFLLLFQVLFLFLCFAVSVYHSLEVEE